MQAALDATGLMLSKDAQTVPGDTLVLKAGDDFKAIFTRPEAYDIQVTSQLTQPAQGMFSLKLIASAKVNTLFSQFLNQSVVQLSATSEVLWGIKKLNLALVLDNTGSMAQSAKMTNLKTAAHNLLSTLQQAATTPGDVQVAIVPFATDVNAGTGNVSAPWIDWTDWEAANGACSKSGSSSQSACVATGTCSKSSKTSQNSCTSAGGTWTPASWTPANHSTWNGCVNDRDQNNDVTNTATQAGSPATLFRAHQATACPTAMIPLSSDWTTLNNKIDAMNPTGNTNVTIGLAWGFQLISPVAPFNAPAPAPDLDKVIVILTDGTNTQNRWSSTESVIDARTQKVCDNVKAANIKLYTVRVIDGNATLLKGCATKASMYYDVQQAVQLESVFGSIAQNLANLRITQ
jgi:Mg-chelatase subunit ChlD